MTSSGQRTVEVALPLPVSTTFTYALAAAQAPLPGTRVRVPFGRRELIGWVTGPGRGAGGRRLKSVLAVLDPLGPSVSTEVLDLCRWIADYYAAPLGLTIRAALPSLLTDVSRDVVRITGPWPATPTQRELALLQTIADRPGPQRVSTLRNLIGKGSIWPEVDRLVKAGALLLETETPRDARAATQKVVKLRVSGLPLGERDRIFARARRQREALEWLEVAGGSVPLSDLLGDGGFSRSVVSGLEKKQIVVVVEEELLRDPFRAIGIQESPDLTSTPQQADVIRSLISALDDPVPLPFLLHGITGSGKTHVYVELIAAV